MNKSLKKNLAFGIIALFAGIVVSPAVNPVFIGNDAGKLSTNEGLVEFTTEIYGIEGAKPHTVKLTKEDANKVEKLIDEIKTKLDNAETREETNAIFNEAVIELDGCGLLPEDMSVEEMQRLITGNYQSTLYEKLLNNLYKNIGKKTFDNNTNLFCLVAGYTTNTSFIGSISLSLEISLFLMNLLMSLLDEILYNIFGCFLSLIYILLFMPFIIFPTIGLLNPLPIGYLIGIGAVRGMPMWFDYYPAEGYVYTMGLLGIKNWNKSFYGQLPGEIIDPLWLLLGDSYPGIAGFTGIKLLLDYEQHQSFYLGSALIVNIDSECPGW